MAEIGFRLMPKHFREAFPTWRSIISPAKETGSTQDGAVILDDILNQALGG